jgi:hypothetical protein
MLELAVFLCIVVQEKVLEKPAQFLDILLVLDNLKLDVEDMSGMEGGMRIRYDHNIYAQNIVSTQSKK